MIKNISYFIVAILLVSCGTSKKAVNANENLETANIINSHNMASPDFNTLAARVYVEYQDEEKLQSITVSLRMEKDKVIWIKASILGITLAKAKITPSRVQYYETIDNTYFDGDFSLLSDWLGTQLDFKKAQAILLGQSIIELNVEEYRSETIASKYKLQPKIQPQNFIHSLLLYAEHFKVATTTISQPDNNRILDVRYDSYQTVDNVIFPTQLHINAIEDDKTTKIDLTYRKIDLNIPIGFPFTIPEGYKEIEL